MSEETTDPIANLLQATSVLAVQPHYDDNDVGAGGTLAALCDAGVEVIYLTVMDDLVGVLDASLSDAAALAQLEMEQRAAGAVIGVKEHHWLGYPDAGPYDYFALRNDIVKHIRMLRPDYLFTCDPWLPHEAHQDHVVVGRAVAEASLLQGMTRLSVDAEVDRYYEPFEISGVVFYVTRSPNTVFDISSTYERKHQALRAYEAQFSAEDLERLCWYIDAKEVAYAEGYPFSHGEPLKVLNTRQMHCCVDP